MQLQSQIDQLLAQRASQWHQILEDGSEAQRAEFVAWLKQSPLHVKEYLETVYVDRVLAHLDAEHAEDMDALLAQIAPKVTPLTANSAPSTAQRRHPNIWTIAAAIGGVMLLAASVLLLNYRFNAAVNYTTSIGEQRILQLADASTVTLNADSKIEVRFTETGRDIQLLSGEALFKVARDTQRPFRVHTATAVVQAIGTQFNIYQRPDGARVSVLEGRVKVTPQLNSAGSTVSESLNAGEEALVKIDGAIQRSNNTDVSKRIAWREQRLVFVETPLEEVVHEFNRYTRTTRLRIEGVSPGSHHYNGIFDATDPDSLAQLLARESDLTIERTKDEIIIRPRR